MNLPHLTLPLFDGFDDEREIERLAYFVLE